MVELLIGKRYIAIGRLGKGMFGQVFMCRNKYTGGVVAVKIAGDRDTLKREAQFYRLLRDIDHVPRLLWFGSEGKFVFMVVPYCGKELGSISALGLPTRALIARTLVDALLHVHTHGVTHSDIKPANIVVDEATNAPMLIDFGLARLGSAPAGRPSKVIGSPMFCSLRVLDLHYPVPADDMEALGLSFIFSNQDVNSLLERENELVRLGCTCKDSFFGRLREQVDTVDYDALKVELVTILTQQDLGLKV